MLKVISKVLSRLKAPGTAPLLLDRRIDDEPPTFEPQEAPGAATAGGAVAAAPPTLPVFDAAKLDELKGIMDQTKFAGLIGQFAQSLEERVRRLEGLLAGSDWADAAREAHDIVSVAGNIGAARLSSLAREIETSCKASNEPRCQSLSTTFADEAADALRALKIYRDAA